MSQVDYTKCDRCGCKISGGMGELEGTVRRPTKIPGDWPWARIQVDLCRGCCTELIAWIKEPMMMFSGPIQDHDVEPELMEPEYHAF